LSSNRTKLIKNIECRQSRQDGVSHFNDEIIMEEDIENEQTHGPVSENKNF